MKLNRTNKKIISLLFAALMITSIFAAFVTPVMAAAPVTVTPHVATLNVTEDIIIRTNANVTWGVNVTGIGEIITINDTAGRFIARTPGVVNVTVNTTTPPHFTNNTTITVRPFPTAIPITPFPTLIRNLTETQQFDIVPGIPTGTDPRVIWSTTNVTPGLGTINATGFFTPISPGTVIVSVHSLAAPTVRNTTTVIIQPPPTAIPLTPSPILIRNLTETQQFIATIPAGVDSRVIWSTTNGTGFGTINATGFFTPISPGTVIVSVRSVAAPTVMSETIVIIQPPPTAIPITPFPTLIRNVNETQPFIATIPAGTDPRVIWSTTNVTPGTGTINATGFFTALTPGTVLVTVHSLAAPTVVNSTTVTIQPLPTAIPITPFPTLIRNVTETQQFIATIPAGVDSRVIWNTTNGTGTGTINATGFFTALTPGTLMVIVRSVAAPAIINTTTVTIPVPPAPTGIIVSPATATLNVTEARNFNATVLPFPGANQSVTWHVVNGTVGTIDVTGLFRANATGTTNVTARSVVDTNITANATVTVVVPVPVLAVIDANRDGEINALDFGILAVSFMRSRGELGFDPRADFDGNGIVNSLDFGLLAVNFGRRV